MKPEDYLKKLKALKSEALKGNKVKKGDIVSLGNLKGTAISFDVNGDGVTVAVVDVKRNKRDKRAKYGKIEFPLEDVEITKK